MAIPDFQSMFLPFLKYLSDGKERTNEELVEHLAAEHNLTPEERNEMLASGTQRRFDSRVHWGKVHLKGAGLIEAVRRGVCRITSAGMGVVKSNPGRIDLKYLDQFPAHATWRSKFGSSAKETVKPLEVNQASPEEIVSEAFKSLKQKLVSDLLEQIGKCSPSFFEELVVRLLVKMGYGGTIRDAGKAIGRSGDEGIDGIIKEDKLGLDTIYIQAKRWKGSVGRPVLQEFVGAMHGKGGKKGVFITTSTFTRDALDYLQKVSNIQIVLIDGERLSDLMIEHDVGVATKQTFEIKKVDFDYFSEEE